MVFAVSICGKAQGMSVCTFAKSGYRRQEVKTYRVVIEKNGQMDVTYVQADKMKRDAHGTYEFFQGKDMVGSFRKHVVQAWSVVTGH